MRPWFAFAMLAACDGSTELARDAGPDAAVHSLPPFTPLLCTGGSAGDPTCPFNYADITDLGAGATMRLLATPSGPRVFLRDIRLTAGPSGLHVEDLRFVVYRDGIAVPQLSPFPREIDLNGNEVLTIDAAALPDFSSPGDQIGLQYGASR